MKLFSQIVLDKMMDDGTLSLPIADGSLYDVMIEVIRVGEKADTLCHAVQGHADKLHPKYRTTPLKSDSPELHATMVRIGISLHDLARNVENMVVGLSEPAREHIARSR